MSNVPVSRGAEEACQQLPAILAAAAAGQTTIITRHGRKIAAVVPAVTIGPSQISLLELTGSGAGLWGERSSDAISELRDEWNR